MRKILIIIILLFFSTSARENQDLDIINMKLVCKTFNSKEIMEFKFSSENFVKLDEYINNEKINNYKLKYLVKKKKIIVYNPDVLPIRQETHIDLDKLEMKTGLFTNRYPLINKGKCEQFD